MKRMWICFSASWQVIGLLTCLANVVAATESFKWKRPLVRTIVLEGKSLHGLALSNSGSGVGSSFQMPVRVEPGRFLWFDKVNEADVLFASDELPRALAAYEQALSFPTIPKEYVPSILLSISRVLATQHRSFEARKVAKVGLKRSRQIKVEPSLTASLWFHFGLYSAMCGHFEEAEDAYKQAISQDPENIDALHHLAVLGLLTGELENFVKHFTALLQASATSLEKRIRAMNLPKEKVHRHASFSKETMSVDMAVWLVDHVMLSLSLDGIPSVLQLRTHLDMPVPRGYGFGEFEANALLVFTSYQTSMIQLRPAIDRELVHFNLAKRLVRVGAWEQAVWHFDFAASVGRQERKPLLMLRAALVHPSILSSSSVSVTLFKREVLEPKLDKLSEHAFSPALADLPAPVRLNACAALSMDAFSRRIPLLQELDKRFFAAVANACGVQSVAQELQWEEKAATGRMRIALVAPEFYNTSAGFMTMPVVAALRAADKVELSLFSWQQKTTTARYLVNPSEITLLNTNSPFGEWQKQLQERLFDVAILVDVPLDFRAYLLAQHRLAPYQISLQLDSFSEQVFFREGAVDEAVHLSPPEPEKSASSYVGALLRFVVAEEVFQPLPERIIMHQGHYFFSNEKYYLVLGDIRSLHPEFDIVVAGIHQIDPDAVVIFTTEEDSVIVTQKFWSRLEERENIDLARVRIFEGSSDSASKAFVKNLDVAVEPFPWTGRSVSIVTLIQLMIVGVPIVGVKSDETSRMTGAALVCSALSLAHFCLVRTLGQLAQRAVQVAAVNETLRVSYRTALRELRMSSQDVSNTSGMLLKDLALRWLRLFTSRSTADDVC